MITGAQVIADLEDVKTMCTELQGVVQTLGEDDIAKLQKINNLSLWDKLRLGGDLLSGAEPLKQHITNMIAAAKQIKLSGAA